MSMGKKFVAALVAEKSLASYFAAGPVGRLFKGNEVQVWDCVSQFVKKHGVLPQLETIEIETGEALAIAEEPASYYLDLMKVRHQEFVIKASMKKAQEQLQPGGEGSEAALLQITQMVLGALTQDKARQILDMRQAYDLLIPHYAAAQHGDLKGLSFGWPYLDEMTGGLRISDTAALVGRPGIGKTWQMLYAAHHGWKQAEEDPSSEGEARMFVSMEMDLLSVAQRIASMNTHVKMSAVKKSSMSTTELKTFKKGVKAMAGFKAPFWIVDGNLTATVDDVYLLAKQLKPKAVFIDGAYLLKHPTERDRYKRVSENADLLKQRIANQIGPVVASWQFARTASKKKATEEVTLEDIAYADAIGQVSSVVLGLFEDETVETLKQRRVKLLKGRNGETGEFLTKWDFEKMDFSQVEAQSVANLAYF